MNKPNQNFDKFKKAISVCLKTIAEKTDIEINFCDEALKMGADYAKIPNISNKLNKNEKAYIRGYSDSAALFIKHSDPNIYAKNIPSSYDAQLIYKELEIARVNSIGAKKLKGVAKNINDIYEKKCQDLSFENCETIEQMPLSKILGLYIFSKATNSKSLPLSDKAIKMVESKFSKKHEKTFQRLKNNVNNQDAFLKTVRQLIEELDIEEAQKTKETKKNKPDKASQKENKEQDSTSEKEEKTEQEKAPSKSSSEETKNKKTKQKKEEDSKTKKQEKQGLSQKTTDISNYEIITGGYKIFTKEFDSIGNAEDICDSYELEALRQELDGKLFGLHSIVTRLANKLQRALMAKQQTSWNFDLEEGYIDPARLARLVANPTNPLSYMQEKQSEFKDTIVTLLIDNSGSMRGRAITIAAICADILSRTLERCKVKVEILGFTTATWRGGKSKKKWEKSGRPENPGRLNDIRHIVYKPADKPWRRAKKNLGLMLKEGILKENIDGEALLWASKRLAKRSEKRKILMVISDGAPIDDATIAANSNSYLEEHLKGVINQIERENKVELNAIGINHDVSEYYKNAVTISNPEELGGTMMNELTKMFTS
jgi:cobaltochelatase CobT